MTILTAFEIANNPGDIFVKVIGPDSENGKFAGIITRGKNHNYKLLISTGSEFNSRAETNEAMKGIVQTAKKYVKELKSSKNL